MFDLKSIIELFAVVVLVVSVLGIQYFIGRIVATRGRWKGDKYPDHLHDLIYRGSPPLAGPVRKRKVTRLSK